MDNSDILIDYLTIGSKKSQFTVTQIVKAFHEHEKGRKAGTFTVKPGSVTVSTTIPPAITDNGKPQKAVAAIVSVYFGSSFPYFS
jgi:hypothetical protein